MFKLGDRVVYPMHGVGRIEGIESRCVCGQNREYYNIVLAGGTRLMLPVDYAGRLRLRAVISADEALAVMQCFRDLEIDTETPWGRRSKENAERLKTGDPCVTAEIVKTLMFRDKTVGLSTGDRQLLVTARNLLVCELSAALEQDADAILAQLQGVLAQIVG